MTECYALQNTAFVAERLGVPTVHARNLQRWVFLKGYPNEPEEYHSAKCYDGGPLDLRPQQASSRRDCPSDMSEGQSLGST